MTFTINHAFVDDEGTLPDPPTLTAPTLVLAASADSGIVGDKITNTPNLVFNSVVTSASDTDELIWRLYKGGVFIAKVTATGGPVAFPSAVAPEGVGDWTVTIEKAGEISFHTGVPESVTVDLLPPVLSSPTATTISPTAINISVSTNGDDGEMRYIGLLGGSDEPSDSQVWAGIDADNVPALKHDNFSIGSAGVKNSSITALANATTYDFYWVHRDDAENLSTKVTASATTDAGSGHCIAYDNWLVRTSGSLTTDTKEAYGDLFDALTTAGLFEADGTSDYFDGFWIDRTVDEATAAIDLTNNANDLTEIGSLTWTAGVGWAGGAGKALDTGINPGLGGFRYTTTSCHLMTWCDTNSEDVYSQAMGAEGAGGSYANFYTKEVFEHKWYVRLNSSTTLGVVIGDPRGMLMATRTGTACAQYQNSGAAIATHTNTAESTPYTNFVLLAGSNGAIINETGRNHSAWSIGAYMDQTQKDALYAALTQFWLDIV